MPIGKNALKRVSNNGYSKVNTSAPDMEHSEIAEPVLEPIKAEPKKTAPKKNTAPKEKKPPVKKPEIEKACKKAESKTKTNIEDKISTEAHPDGFLRFGLGDDLPVHLL